MANTVKKINDPWFKQRERIWERNFYERINHKLNHPEWTGGPGQFDIATPEIKGGKFSSLHRFVEKFNEIPGPGYYGGRHEHIVEHYHVKPSTNVPKTEWTKKSNDQLINFSSIPPNFYKNVQSQDSRTMEYKTKTLLRSKSRGPYDLFTGERDSTTLHSYQISKEKFDNEMTTETIPTSLDELLMNRYKGKINPLMTMKFDSEKRSNKTEKRRNIGIPKLDIIGNSNIRKSKFPFGREVKTERYQTDITRITPGYSHGDYFKENDKIMKLYADDGHRSKFESLTPRWYPGCDLKANSNFEKIINKLPPPAKFVRKLKLKIKEKDREIYEVPFEQFFKMPEFQL